MQPLTEAREPGGWARLRELAAMLAVTAGFEPRARTLKAPAPVTIEPWQIGPFMRPLQGNPVIRPNPASVFDCPMRKAKVRWEILHTFNPAAIVRDGKVVVLYRAEDDSGINVVGMHTSRLGMAVSEDGVTFTRHPQPVFHPADDAQKKHEWHGGTEDPRLVEADDGTYVLLYTQWNRRAPHLAVATSRDLLRWTKHGHAFQHAHGGKYATRSSKAGGIVTRLDPQKGRLIATRIDGQYWMYWGEGAIHLASSNDLVRWTPLEDGQGKLLKLLAPRTGFFDSAFPEVGPPPVLTDDGIVLLYNGRNATWNNDPTLGAGAYAVGEALFDAKEPGRLLARTDHPLFRPELPYERSGQYAAGTTFSEGLVWFKGRWLMYYGCADSLVSVAMTPAQG